MDKDELIKLAEELYQEAFDANAYFLIMQQYEQNFKKYETEMQMSSAFYQVVYDALQKACFMEIAKLYDKSDKVFSIGLLIKQCKDNISIFSEYRNTIEYEVDGQKHIFSVPYQHYIKPAEECFFKKEVQSQRELYKILNNSPKDSIPVSVNLKFSEFLEFYYKRFCSLSKKQENIRVQRNKIYAHNDKEKILNLNEIMEKNPIYYNDIQELIEFALDVTKLVISSLTGDCKANQYCNIDDWKNTLILTRKGIKYEDCQKKQMQKELEEENFSQNKE